ncbi:MAG: PQQ-dependent sugar dehydrogenase [Blastocatellia bacterium]|nr:PQQ-dependent sugar dehydrogenase [Blastocatellia bacterium]
MRARRSGASSRFRISSPRTTTAGSSNSGRTVFYAATGDGGSANDPDDNGQDINELLGKILRFDVNGAQPYAIPSDNPFVGLAGRDEIYAYGLRNTWRYSFDRESGQLWAGDVGQNQYEEVDIITRGGNYGWRAMEGVHCRPPTTGCDTSGKILPVFEYAHSGSNGVSSGCSITGGYVYRGSAIPSLFGKYVFADYCLGSGQILTLVPGETTAVTMVTGAASEPVVSFGEDEAGELYVVTDSVFGGRGGVFKIVLRDGECDLRCPADVLVTDGDGNGSEVATFDLPTPTGECGTLACVPASGSTFTVGTTEVTCTSATGGSCTFNVVVEGTVDLAVTSCSPASARRKATLTVTVNGTGFVQGATVSFGTKITVNSVTYVSPSRLDVNIKIKKKAARVARDVVVTNPGGASATGIGAFTVE